MAKNISLLGADYPDVPAVQLPQTGGGTATFYDIAVIDALNSTSTTDALSANQGRVLDEKIANINISFGSNAKTLTQNLTDNWMTAVPNDGKIYLVKIISQHGDFYGTICRYSNNYGAGVVSRYDGRVCRIQMNNGLCSSYQLQNRIIEVVSTGSKTLSGNGNISYTFQDKALVLAAYSTSSDIVCNAYPSSGADDSGSKTWWIHCRNANTAGSVASGSITCYLIFISME